MNYKLAKKLKEAGFPLIDIVGYAYDENEKVVGFEIEATVDFPEEWIYIPTLSELIEACGKYFISLHYGNKHKSWKVNGAIADSNTKSGFIELKGETPEEAVALLYIKLNT